MTITTPEFTLEEIIRRQNFLNNEKAILKKMQNVSEEPERYADQWLKLSVEYAKIDAKANSAYCMERYRHFSGIKPEVIRMEVPPLADQEKSFIPEPEMPDDIFDWQNRADMGD